VRIAQRVGLAEVIRAARDLGVTSDIPTNPSMPLGTAGVSLIEMTAAYAAVAGDSYPVRPTGLAEEASGGSWFGGSSSAPQRREPVFSELRALLNAVVTRGTGTGANLAMPAYGKTGTTQDYRDALFIGFAGDLVVGVWIGNDDNSPLPGVTGGAAPARIWRNFMTQALDTQPAGPAQPVGPPIEQDIGNFAAPTEPIGNELIPIDPPAPPVGPFGPPDAIAPPGEEPQSAPPDGPDLPAPDAPRSAPPPALPPREPVERPRTQPTPPPPEPR